MSSIINKVKDALHSDKDKTHESPEGTHGPHSSKTANAADPRVDSDRDHRGNPTAGTTGYGHESTTGHSTHTGAHTGAHTGTGAYGSSGTTQGSHGPHSSNIANTVDPRVDSDRDHRGAPGNTFGSGTHTTGAHSTGTHTSGLTGSTGHSTHTGAHTGTGAFGSSGTTEGNHGPHSSNIANTVDPRVDSDRDHRGAPGNTFGSGTHTTGAHSTGTHGSGLPGTAGHSTHTGAGAYGSTTGGGAYGSGAPEGTHGPHGSRAANAADPRIDSDRDHRAQHHLPGPADNTAGPHKSDALNKIDPRVDSDLDASRTYGGDKTHSGGY